MAKPKTKCLVKKPKPSKRCCIVKKKKRASVRGRGRRRSAAVRRSRTIVQVPQDPPPVIHVPAPVVQVDTPNVTVPEPVVQVITQPDTPTSEPLQTALAAFINNSGGITLFTQGSPEQSILNRSGVLRELRPDGLIVLEPAGAVPGEFLYYAVQQIAGFQYPRYQA